MYAYHMFMLTSCNGAYYSFGLQGKKDDNVRKVKEIRTDLGLHKGLYPWIVLADTIQAQSNWTTSMLLLICLSILIHRF